MNGHSARTPARMASRVLLFDPAYHVLSGPVRRICRLLSLTPQHDVGRAARLVCAGQQAGQQEVEPMLDQLLDRHPVSEPAPARFNLMPSNPGVA
jgi:hypothetical protein